MWKVETGRGRYARMNRIYGEQTITGAWIDGGGGERLKWGVGQVNTLIPTLPYFLKQHKSPFYHQTQTAAEL